MRACGPVYTHPLWFQISVRLCILMFVPSQWSETSQEPSFSAVWPFIMQSCQSQFVTYFIICIQRLVFVLVLDLKNCLWTERPTGAAKFSVSDWFIILFLMQQILFLDISYVWWTDQMLLNVKCSQLNFPLAQPYGMRGRHGHFYWNTLLINSCTTLVILVRQIILLKRLFFWLDAQKTFIYLLSQYLLSSWLSFPKLHL